MSSPDNHEQTTPVPWSLALPLPFRVQAVIGLGMLCWATNLHGLDYMNIDVVGAMDLHLEPSHPPIHLPHHRNTAFRPRPSAESLYRSTYRLFVIYTAWCFSSWALFRLVTHNDPSRADAFGFIPCVSTLVILLCLISPFSLFERRERDKFLLALRRCLFSARRHAIYFSDVICADIATSFAKVLGDVWTSLIMLLPGNSLLYTPEATGWTRLLAPTVMSLPYLIRFRQCIIEYMLPSNDSQRPLFNAIKYASSFPVIYLSAAQRPHGDDSEPWLSESMMFRLWLFSALVNSLYSYWWDVTNDWGLTLLSRRTTSTSTKPMPPRRLVLPRLHSNAPLLEDSSPERSVKDTTLTQAHDRRHLSHPYGLRPVLLFPLAVYPFLIVINLVLRLTWSIKLSSHLHKVDRTMSIFYLEMAEVIRRWMWVFLRVEWEIIKKGSQYDPLTAFDDAGYSSGDSEFELVQAPAEERIRGNAQFE
ncbi:EXS family-domain-containing protein [Flagelloscypha sp. PMI_526]|nr:EXS family-domain-containing protein [Flagelloscypha sp. PMI_526]